MKKARHLTLINQISAISSTIQEIHLNIIRKKKSVPSDRCNKIIDLWVEITLVKKMIQVGNVNVNYRTYKGHINIKKDI